VVKQSIPSKVTALVKPSIKPEFIFPTHCPEGHEYLHEGVSIICDGCNRNPDNATFETMDRMVDIFACVIKAEMRVNHYKGKRATWLSRTINEALLEVHQHVSKLHNAVTHPDDSHLCGCDLYLADHDPKKCTGADLRLEYAADVAACAMMLVDLLGLLNPGENRDSLPIPELKSPRP